MKKLLLVLLLLLPTQLLQAQEYFGLPDTVFVAVSGAPEAVRPELEDLFKTSAQASFMKMNHHRKQKVKFLITSDTAYADIHIKLVNYQLVARNQQNTALMLTILGVATPVLLAASGVPFPVFFYFTPRNNYLAAVRFSPVLEELGFISGALIERKVATGYAANDLKNEGKIAADFGLWMRTLSKRWNQKHLKALRKAG